MSSKPNKVRNRVNFINRSSYKEFIKKHPDEKISYEEFITILKRSNICIREHILENPLGFKLPYEFGYIAVDKFKGLGHYTAVDWVATRKLGRKIPLLNLHSFGYYFKIKLYNNPKKVPFNGYKMNAHRIIKRMLAAKIKSGFSKYINIDKSYFTKRLKINEQLKNKQIG